MRPTVTTEVLERYRVVSTCQVSDGLANLGMSPLGLVGIEPLEPATAFVGLARTVLFRGRDEALADDRLEYLAHVQPGDVVVIDNGGRLDCSSWGGQRSIGARQRGAIAAVLNGAYRDVDELRTIGFPVYGRGRAVAGSRYGGLPVAVDEPLLIDGCAVMPGDVVVGDASGVIVVPAGAAEAVLAEAERVAAAERRVSVSVGTGADFLKVRSSVRAQVRP